MASSLINAYERHLVFTYLFNLVARSANARMRHVTEPDCVPEWIAEHADILECDSYLRHLDWSRSELRAMLGSLRDRGKRPGRDTIARYLRRLAQTAGLSAQDLAILEVLIRYKTNPVIESLLDRIDRPRWPYIFSLRNPVLAGVLGASPNRLHERFAPSAPLIRSGLVSVDSDNDLVVVKRLLRLAGAPDDDKLDVTRVLLGDPVPSELDWSDFEYLGPDRRHIRQVLKGALKSGATGVNILLYGPPGTGKTEFSKVLAARLGADLFSIGEADESGNEPTRSERLGELRMAHLVARDRKSIVLFDEMDDLLGSDAEWGSLAPMFASRTRGSEGSKVFLNRVLEQAPVPTIWTMNDVRSVDPVILRRMMFALELRMPPASARANIWDRQLARHRIAAEPGTGAALAKEFPVAAGVAEGAIKGAALIGGGVAAVRHGVESLMRVVHTDGPAAREVSLPEQYDPSLIRADTDPVLLADQIAGGAARHFSLCLEGPPGSGKSAYVRYLAGRLGMPVLQQRASDLLSPFVGETEHNIASAFREARAAQAFLVFDEADSLVADRRRAHRNWEVTAVNEMLTWMESHPLPFACTTNLGSVLDPATLRRFLFKITLGYLSAEQARAAFRLYFDLPAPASVAALTNLTPADFAVVRNQARIRGDLGDPAALADRLRAECHAKPEEAAAIGFGLSS
jgi:SpoVK/Ycf46/Vps4 family AAA+-type ATPase